MTSIRNRLAAEHNLGSVRQLIFLPLKYIDLGLPMYGVKLYNTGINISNINLNTVTTWFSSEFVLQECNWETEEQATDQGTLYKEKITWTIAKDYNAHRANFDEMEGQEFAVLIFDNNKKGTFFGYQFIDGEKRGMRFSKKKNTGTKIFDRNHWQLSFYMECHQLPYVGLYTDDSIVDGGGGTWGD